MQQNLQQQLNQILPRVTSREFLAAEGLGNEIGFWVFDYPAESELQVREHVHFIASALATRHSDIKFEHINLFSTVISYLTGRKFLDKSFELQKEKGNDALMRALAGPMAMKRLAPYIVDTHEAADQDLIFISGIGSVWPLMRGHDLLNNLHALLGNTPVVLFYPGSYDGQSLSLFGKVTSNNYYRAFKLVP
jgi:hypothetical protein